MPTPIFLIPTRSTPSFSSNPMVSRGLTGEVLQRIEAKGYVLKGLKIKQASRELLEGTTRSTGANTSSKDSSNS